MRAPYRHRIIRLSIFIRKYYSRTRTTTTHIAHVSHVCFEFDLLRMRSAHLYVLLGWGWCCWWQVPPTRPIVVVIMEVEGGLGGRWHVHDRWGNAMLRRPLLGVGVVDELLKRGRPLCWKGRYWRCRVWVRSRDEFLGLFMELDGLSVGQSSAVRIACYGNYRGEEA